VAVHLVPIQTGDGSYTFYNVTENIYFRSLQGARSEAFYVFVTGARLPERGGDWSVLELGLGPGMNFLVTAQAFLARAEAGTLRYHVVENAPLSPEKLAQLAYLSWFKYPAVYELLQQALSQAVQAVTFPHVPAAPILPIQLRWQIRAQVIELVLYPCAWEVATLPARLSFDAVYHDPFGPAANPECWGEPCFAWERAHLSETGLITTYGASTPMRRAMAQSGLYLASRKGSGNKREMTLAARNPEALSGYTLLSQEKYLK
jgi:tRNA 5-methylaminomethyl-2-thiouridine biosynthesis bifunctional protein